MTRYNKQCPETIQEMFGTIAKHYDKANTILSFNMHKKWNQQLVDLVTKHNVGSTLLDLCAGTGDIAFAYLKQAKEPSRAILLDFCQDMLDCAVHKAKKMGFENHIVEYVQGDAQNVPFGSSFVSYVTIAYGIRNIKNPNHTIREAFRVLKPGGTLGILELTEPANPLMKYGHKVYLKTILPTVGRLITSNRDAYGYLCESIQQFVPPDRLLEMMLNNGFVQTSKKELMGGVATILIGRKPSHL